MSHARAARWPALQPLAALALSWFVVAPAQAAKNLGIDVECGAFKLEGASGVPNDPQHAYRFSGTCRLVQKGESGGDFTAHTVLTFPVFALARWDLKRHELREQVEVPVGVQWQGKPASGVLDSMYSCNDDPVIRSATCAGKGHKNSTSIPELSEHYLALRPFTRGKTTLALATAMSASTSPPEGSPPPKAAVPPPPHKKPPQLKSTVEIHSAPPTTLVAARLPMHRQPPGIIELESRIADSKATAGPLAVQSMQSFGPQWDSGAQLFWRAPAPTGSPKVQLTVPVTFAPGRYAVTLNYTVAPDYGNVRILLDQEEIASYDGTSSTVSRRRLALGDLQWASGVHRLVFQVSGKSPQSKGFFVGVDSLEMQPLAAASPPETPTAIPGGRVEGVEPPGEKGESP